MKKQADNPIAASLEMNEAIKHFFSFVNDKTIKKIADEGLKGDQITYDLINSSCKRATMQLMEEDK